MTECEARRAVGGGWAVASGQPASRRAGQVAGQVAAQGRQGSTMVPASGVDANWM